MSRKPQIRRTPSAQAAEDAADGITTAEQKTFMREMEEAAGDLGQVPEGYSIEWFEAAQEARARGVLEGMVEGTHAALDVSLVKKITEGTGAVLRQLGVKQLDPTRTLSSQLTDVMNTGMMHPQQVDDILGQSGTSLSEMADRSHG